MIRQAYKKFVQKFDLKLIKLSNVHEKTCYAQAAPRANYVNFVPMNDSLTRNL